MDELPELIAGYNDTHPGVDVRITVFYWIALVAVATFILLKTKIGNWIFAVGGETNVDAATTLGQLLSLDGHRVDLAFVELDCPACAALRIVTFAGSKSNLLPSPWHSGQAP